MSKSKSDFRQEAMMSQRLAKDHPDYSELAGSDSKTSKKIQRLKVFVRHGFIKEEEVKILLDLLNGDRMALFATSERTNEITKMGLQMPKGPSEVDFNEDTG